MANWKLTVVFADFWRNEEMTFEQKRDLAVKRIKGSRWINITDQPEWLEEITEGLEASWDTSSFDFAMIDLYDLADEDLVWIDTISKVVKL
jgi:hypothetical protein